MPFDAVTVISEAEASRYRGHVTDQHEPVVVGNGVDMDRFKPVAKETWGRHSCLPGGEADNKSTLIQPAAEGRQECPPHFMSPVDEPIIVFSGVMSYKPNIDAAAWFARQVMPRVLAAVPKARFDIVGKSPAREVEALDELPGVRVVGPVDDTADVLRASAVAVAPMQIAPGVQNKVLEAMACGLPVVCSSGAAGGIDATPGEHLLVSDDPADCAAQCVRLLLNTDERARLGSAARYRVQQRYDWASAATPMLDLLACEAPTPSA